MDAKKIIIEMEDGTTKEIFKGMCAEFTGETISMMLVDIDKVDIVRIAYGILVTVEQLGMTGMLKEFSDLMLLPDEVDGEVEE